MNKQAGTDSMWSNIRKVQYAFELHLYSRNAE